LNFSARPPASRPAWRCDPLAETDSFGGRGYPRNEFVRTGRVKTTRPAVTAPPPARADGVSPGHTRRSCDRPVRTEKQGSNIRLAAPGPRSPGDSQN
jgi:hypothetical protein